MPNLRICRRTSAFAYLRQSNDGYDASHSLPAIRPRQRMPLMNNQTAGPTVDGSLMPRARRRAATNALDEQHQRGCPERQQTQEPEHIEKGEQR